MSDAPTLSETPQRSGMGSAEASLHVDTASALTAFDATRFQEAPAIPHVRDILALGKPNIVLMSVIVAVGSMAIAPAAFPTWDKTLLILLGIALSVAGAGALNMVIERDVDGLMARTKTRPLPSRRADVWFALAFGVVLSALSLPILYAGGGPVPVALCVFAQFSYVLVYTPMKQKSWWAVVVGAVPGAMPALMGSTAVTGEIESVGAALFGLLFFWQIPHFLAISIYRQREYTAAGYDVLPQRHGLDATKVMIVATAFPLLPIELAFVVQGVAGVIYGVAATLLTVWFLGLCILGFSAEKGASWARRVFIGSLVWQTGVFAALALDVAIRSMM